MFDSLKSGKGPCCSDADGFAVSDPDWESKNGHYLVRIDNEWVEVPDDAVITEPNRVCRTMVWPFKGAPGVSIRCFMPDTMTLAEPLAVAASGRSRAFIILTSVKVSLGIAQ